MSQSVSVALRWATVDSLVDLLKLAGFSLRDVQPNRQIVVVFDQFLDCASPRLKVSTQGLTLLSQLLDHVRDLNAVKSGLSELLVLAKQVLVDALKLLDVLLQVAKHLIGPLKLLDQGQILSLSARLLPSLHGSPHSLQVVVLAKSDCQFLSSDKVIEQLLSLERQSVDRIAHASETRLGRADQVLVSDDLVDQLLLGQRLELVFGISHVILPLPEVGGQWMVHPVDDLGSSLLSGLSLSDECLQLVESFGNDREVTVLEEE